MSVSVCVLRSVQRDLRTVVLLCLTRPASTHSFSVQGRCQGTEVPWNTDLTLILSCGLSFCLEILFSSNPSSRVVWGAQETRRQGLIGKKEVFSTLEALISDLNRLSDSSVVCHTARGAQIHQEEGGRYLAGFPGKVTKGLLVNLPISRLRHSFSSTAFMGRRLYTSTCCWTLENQQ